MTMTMEYEELKQITRLENIRLPLSCRRVVGALSEDRKMSHCSFLHSQEELANK